MIKKNMKKFLIVAATLLSIITTTSGCGTVRSVQIIAPSLFGTTEIQEGIYLDTKATQEQRNNLLDAINISKKKIVKFYGSLQTNPKIIACSSEACYKKFGGISAKGKNYGSVAILLSPRGISPEIITHEWSHRKLSERLGFLKSRKIAYWFDKGLAVYISGDERYSHNKWAKATKNGKTAPGLDQIDTLRKWLKVNREKDHIMSHGTAREEISLWYQKVGEEGLKQLIKRLSNGEDFYSAYFAVANIDSTFLKRTSI